MASLKTVRFTNKFEPCRHQYSPPSKHATLHEAVRNGDIEAVRDFLKTGHDVNGTDASGNTPLLLAVCIKQEEIYDAIVAVLIENGADVNAYNKGGSQILEAILKDERCTPEIINRPDDEARTALHLAAQFCHKNCLRMLIEHGGNLAATNEENESVSDIIFEQLISPELFIIEILNDNIIMKQTEKYKYIYRIDFSVVAPKKCGRQMDVISSLLVAASEDEKIEVLQHPLIELYLILKWERICYFFYLWITAYFIFAASMGIYVTLVIHHVNKMETLKSALKFIVVLTAAGLLGHAILQCVLDRRKYFQRYEMWMNLICTSLSLTVAITVDDFSGNSTEAGPPNWVLHLTSIAVLMAWIELMLLLGRLPSLGYYALMFSAVLQNVVKVLLAYICLLIGFMLSFSVQFHELPHFKDPWRAFVKTTAMVMGEFEYGDMFAETGDSPKILPATSRIIFLIFLILTSIVLMNLMVGVAVSDIQELLCRGRAKKLEKQAEFLQQLEIVLSSEHLKSEYIPEFFKKLIIRRSYINIEFEVKSCAEFQRRHKIPKRIIDSLTSIAKGHKLFKEEEFDEAKQMEEKVFEKL